MSGHDGYNAGSGYPPPSNQGYQQPYQHPYQQPPYQQPYPPPPQGQQYAYGAPQPAYQPPPPAGWAPPPAGYQPQPTYGTQQEIYPPAYTPSGYGQAEYGGEEPSQWKGDIADFEDKSMRMAFIRKVYAIISVQLFITFGTVALFMYNAGLNHFVRTHSWTMWVAFGFTMVIMLVLGCVGDMRRRTPHNYILLLLFTLGEAYLVATCTAFYRVDQVLMAVGITAACTVALTIFAFQTKIDFTMSGGILMCALTCLMMFGLLTMFFKSKILEIVYCSIGALVFMVYIIYDTQVMIGGEHENGISPEEYVFAALSIYMDVINLFLNILRLVGAASSNDNS